jgi:hypothetical protein
LCKKKFNINAVQLVPAATSGGEEQKGAQGHGRRAECADHEQEICPGEGMKRKSELEKENRRRQNSKTGTWMLKVRQELHK